MTISCMKESTDGLKPSQATSVVEELAYYKKRDSLFSLEDMEQYATDRDIRLTDNQRVAICDELTERMTWMLYEVFEKILGNSFQG